MASPECLCTCDGNEALCGDWVACAIAYNGPVTLVFCVAGRGKRLDGSKMQQGNHCIPQGILVNVPQGQYVNTLSSLSKDRPQTQAHKNKNKKTKQHRASMT